MPSESPPTREVGGECFIRAVPAQEGNALRSLLSQNQTPGAEAAKVTLPPNSVL